MNLLQRLLLLCLAALLTQCATSDKETGKETDKPKNDPVAVGIIEFVNPDQKFVLIKMQSRLPMPIGQALTALDATGTLTQLSVSPERKGTHVTADIKSGNPRPGNLVIYQPDPLASSPTLPSTPQPTAANSLNTTSSGQVEWRDGQPPPMVTPGIISPPPANPLPLKEPIPTIPLGPLPEEPPTGNAP